MKWWIVLIIIIAVAALIYFGQDWQVLSMIGAAIAGPFKFISGLFGKNADEIRDEHKKIRKREREFQNRLESGIREKEETVGQLEKEISDLDAKIEQLEKRKSEIDGKFDDMSLDELSEVGAGYFGS